MSHIFTVSMIEAILELQIKRFKGELGLVMFGGLLLIVWQYFG